MRCGGIPRGILRVTLGDGCAVGLEGIPRNTLWGEGRLEGPLCGVWAAQGSHCKREELIALAELRAQQQPDLSRERAAAGRDSVLGLSPTFRKVKAVHLSSSVPSGHSMRPTKQAFQISSTKSGEGMRCGEHTQILPVLGWQQSTSPHTAKP